MILNTISNTTNCNPNKISSSLNPIIWIIIGITRIIFKITISSFNIFIMSKLSRHAPFGILITTIFCKKTFRIPKSIITIIRFSFPFILYGGGTRITSTRWSIRIINITSISSTKTTRSSSYFIIKPIFIIITPRRRYTNRHILLTKINTSIMLNISKSFISLFRIINFRSCNSCYCFSQIFLFYIHV